MPTSLDMQRLRSPDGLTLPSRLIAPEFGKIVVRQNPTGYEVSLTLLMEPQGVEAEGWQTGVALDGSASMKAWFGHVLEGKVPPELAEIYRARGWVEVHDEDGRRSQRLQKPAVDDAIARGVLRFTDNVVQPLAREFLAYLAGNLDADGGTTLVYWACGDGSGVEVVGDFTTQQCATLRLSGPRTMPFGSHTMLTPALEYFTRRFASAPRGMYIFITDGRIDDLPRVKTTTIELARRIASGNANPVKCVLVGVGSRVDEQQMTELDDLDTGTAVDVWDHKIARDMRGLVEIFSEVVSERRIVAPVASIYDSRGERVKLFSDGLPARVTFQLPPGATGFELDVGGRRFPQPLACLS